SNTQSAWQHHWAIAFVHDVFPVRTAGLFAGATLARALDVVVGDGGLLGLFDHVVQGWVGRRVTATGTRCNFDVFDHLCEFFAALGVIRGLFMLRSCPL